MGWTKLSYCLPLVAVGMVPLIGNPYIIFDRLATISGQLFTGAQEERISQHSTRAARILRGLRGESTAGVRAMHHDEVDSVQELSEMLAYFFSNGAAAERRVRHKDTFQLVVNTALSLPGHTKSVGGNTALMALRMAKAGASGVTLGMPGTAKLASEFSKHGIEVIRPMSGDVQADLEDDVHLILEWKSGQKWGSLVSPRANRLALHRDIANPELWAVQPLMNKLRLELPSTLIIGGIQLMQNYPGWDGGEWARQRAAAATMDTHRRQGVHPAKAPLENLKTHVSNLLRPMEDGVPPVARGPLPEGQQQRAAAGLSGPTRVHFELASMSDLAFLAEVDQNILSVASSLGGNEQELGFLYEYLMFGRLSHVQPHTPRVAGTLDKMRAVMTSLSARGLTRLHVHTLAFQAIITVGEGWVNMPGSMAMAALAAVEWVCPSGMEGNGISVILDESFAISLETGAARRALDDKTPVACWDEQGDAHFHICVCPNVVCLHPDKTIGAGDNISAAGLLLQL